MPRFLDEDTGSKVQPRNFVVFDSRQQECHSMFSEAAQANMTQRKKRKEVAAIPEVSPSLLNRVVPRMLSILKTVVHTLPHMCRGNMNACTEINT